MAQTPAVAPRTECGNGERRPRLHSTPLPERRPFDRARRVLCDRTSGRVASDRCATDTTVATPIHFLPFFSLRFAQARPRSDGPVAPGAHPRALARFEATVAAGFESKRAGSVGAHSLNLVRHLRSLEHALERVPSPPLRPTLCLAVDIASDKSASGASSPRGMSPSPWRAAVPPPTLAPPSSLTICHLLFSVCSVRCQFKPQRRWHTNFTTNVL